MRTPAPAQAHAADADPALAVPTVSLVSAIAIPGSRTVSARERTGEHAHGLSHT